MNTNKKELINKMEEVLGEKYGMYMKTKDESSFIYSLRRLPIENLQKMVDCDISNCDEFDKAYQLYGRCGALRFKPYIITEEDDNPSLCIRHNRFLHMFRGYHFQASGTIDGIGDCGSGAYRTDFLTKGMYGDKIRNKGLISYMLWWAALIDVGFNFNNFYDMFSTNKEVLEQFLEKSMAYWGVQRNQHWSDIAPYIVFSEGTIDTFERKVCHIYDDKAGVVAYLAIGKKTIQVQMADNRLLTITIPELNDVGYDLQDEDQQWKFEDEVQTLEDNHYLEMIAVMALNLCGIKINFINWYAPFGKLKSMSKINAPAIKNIKSLNDIYNYEPDEF